MTVLLQRSASLEWGALFIADPVPGAFPEWADSRQILATPAFIAIPVRHVVDGDVVLTITDDPDAPVPGLAYRGILEVPSRIVCIGHGNGALAAVACFDARVAVAIGTNRPASPDRITVAVEGGQLTDPPDTGWVRSMAP